MEGTILFTHVYGSLGILDAGNLDSSTLLLCCTVSKGVTFWCTLGENTGVLDGAVSCTLLLCYSTSKGMTIDWCTLGEDTVLFLGTASGTMLLCCTVSKGLTFWCSLRENISKGLIFWCSLGEDTGSLLGTTVRSDVFWVEVD